MSVAAGCPSPKVSVAAAAAVPRCAIDLMCGLDVRAKGVTIGAKRIDVAQKAVTASSLRFSVTEGYGKPTGLKAFAFAPEPCDPEPFRYAL